MAVKDYPGLNAAIAWLKSLGIVDDAQLEAIIESLVGEASDTFGQSFRERVVRELAESLERGESRDQWRERINSVVDVTAGEAETIGRTFTHRAYHEGLAQVADNPVVAEALPYWRYFATIDTRVRPEHEAMDGKVAHRESPLAAKMLELLNEYNCRCSRVLISREEAEGFGIDDDTGWVEPPDQDEDQDSERQRIRQLPILNLVKV